MIERKYTDWGNEENLRLRMLTMIEFNTYVEEGLIKIVDLKTKLNINEELISKISNAQIDIDKSVILLLKSIENLYQVEIFEILNPELANNDEQNYLSLAKLNLGDIENVEHNTACTINNGLPIINAEDSKYNFTKNTLNRKSIKIGNLLTNVNNQVQYFQHI